MDNIKCRVETEELQNDTKPNQADERERIIGDRVDHAMGNNPDLVMEVIGNEDECIAAIMEIAQFEDSPTAAGRSFKDAARLATIAHDLNKLIAEKLRDYVEQPL